MFLQTYIVVGVLFCNKKTIEIEKDVSELQSMHDS